MVACIENNTGPELIYEPAGSAHYYINNQCNVDFNISYTTFGSQADSLKTIPIDTSIRILEDGSIGNNPFPSSSFSEILFYSSADLSKPVLTINPVEDEKWNINGSKGFEDSNYELTEYELVITNEDVN